jgi:NADP-reducing hydrogenase subunit HndB
MPEPLKPADIEKIRQNEIQKRNRFLNSAQIQVIVSYGTPAIAAGAHKTLQAFQEAINQNNLYNVLIYKTGNSCLDSLEPVVEVIQADQPGIKYGRVTPDVARQIVDEHLINGRILQSFQIQNV